MRSVLLWIPPLHVSAAIADCIEGAVEKGVLYGTGVYEAGAVRQTALMQQAYEMGKNV